MWLTSTWFGHFAFTISVTFSASSSLTSQTVQNAAADTGSLLQLFHREIFFAVDGHLFQCIGGSILDRLRQVGALGDLPESSQVSFF